MVVDAALGFCCFILLFYSAVEIKQFHNSTKVKHVQNGANAECVIDIKSLVLAVKVQLCVTVKVNPLKCDACELPAFKLRKYEIFYFHFHARIIYAINSDFSAKLLLLNWCGYV